MSEAVLSPLTPVFLLAENRLLRETLVRILTEKLDVTVSEGAVSPAVFEQLLASEAKIILLDSSSLTAHGSRLVGRLKRMLPNASVVMIGMERDRATFFRAIREGVMGYVLKDVSALEMVNIIRAVASGEAVCPPCFSKAIFRCAAQQLNDCPEPSVSAASELSRREQQLVGLVRLGLTNKEIASRLNLSAFTIKNHVHRIFCKLGVHDRMAMIERAEQIQAANSPAHPDGQELML